jgi:hypothetical protein
MVLGNFEDEISHFVRDDSYRIARKCHFDPFGKLRVNSGRNLSRHSVEDEKLLANN